MRVISGRDIAALVDAAALMAPIRDAMRSVSAGRAELPLRSMVKLPGANRMGIMGGWLADPEGHGVKVLSLFPDNPRHGRSSHAGLYLLFDPETGLARACLDAAELTAIRTASATAVATDVLARPNCTTLALLGCGEQAHTHLAAMRAIRPIARAVVWGRDPDRARAFAEAHGIETAASVEEAVAEADIVVTATPAAQPFLHARHLRPGQHIAAVGASVANMQELHTDILPMVSLFTDYLPSLEAQAAEVIAARAGGIIAADHPITEIGLVLDGAPGRTSAEQITVYRSLGIAAQDLAAAHFILARAEAENRGVVVDMA
jgi:alanine dehydrogenase